jgi:hypothetical protein
MVDITIHGNCLDAQPLCRFDDPAGYFTSNKSTSVIIRYVSSEIRHHSPVCYQNLVEKWFL